MKRTDDFLGDLETQLAAAAAAPARRRPSLSFLRPAVTFAVAAAAVTAFVLAAGSDPDPERAAQPPVAQSGGPFALSMAHHGQCATEPGRAELPTLSVLDRPDTGNAASASPFARTARADVPVTVVPRQDVGPCVFDGDRGPGACVVVSSEGSEVKTACWSREDIDAGRAAAGLGAGFVVALVPDRFEQVTFVIGDERDTYAVTDNVVVGNLASAKEGVYLEMVPGTAEPTGCADGTVEESVLPGALVVAVPVLGLRDPEPLPDTVADLLAKAGAARMWLDQARRLEGDGATEAWIVPVADSRFAECGDPRVNAPRAFEGPGVCLVILHAAAVKSALCTDLDDLGGIATAAVPGGRVAAGFLPHGAHSLGIEGRNLRDMQPPWGVVFGPVPDREALSVAYIGPDGPIDAGDLRSRTVMVVGAEERAAIAASQRLRGAGIDRVITGSAPAGDGSRVMYAAGMARAARQVAELLRVQDVLPLDLATGELADPQADVVVVAGEDLRP